MDAACKRYGLTPDALLALPPRAFMVTVGVALTAEREEREHGTGEYWWLGLLRAFNFSVDDAPAEPDAAAAANVRWL